MEKYFWIQKYFSIRRTCFPLRRTCTCQILVHKVSASTSDGKFFEKSSKSHDLARNQIKSFLQGKVLKTLAILGILGKKQGIRPAFFSGIPGNFEA